MKKIFNNVRTIGWILMLILFGAVYLNSSIVSNLEIEFDVNLFIVLLDLLFVFCNEHFGFINSFIVKVSIFLTILLQVVCYYFSFIFEFSFLVMTFRLLTLLVMAEMAFYIVYSFFLRNITTDIIVLKYKIRHLIKKINHNQNITENIDTAIGHIIDWIDKQNEIITNKKAKQIASLLKEIVISMQKSQIVFKDNTLKNTDKMLESIFHLYKKIGNEKIQRLYMSLILELLELNLNLGNRKQIKKYVSFYCSLLAEYEFSIKNNESNQINLLCKYISFCKDKIEKNNDELSLLIDGIDRLCVITHKYDFNYDCDVTIHFVQSYVSFYIEYGRNCNENKLDVEQLVNIISRIGNHGNVRSLELFEKNIIYRIIDSESNISKKCDLIFEIIRVYSFREYDSESINIQVISYLNDLYVNANLEDRGTIISTQLLLLTKVKNKFKNVLSDGNLINYLISLEEKDRAEFIKENRNSLLFNENNFNYTQKALLNNIEEDNLEQIFDLFALLISNVNSTRINIEYRITFSIFDELFEKYIKKYSLHSSILKEKIKKPLKCVEMCIRSFEDDNFQIMLFSLLFHYLDNSDLVDYCYNLIIEYSYYVIENNNPTVLKSISNQLGWLILHELQKDNVNEHKANKYIKDVVRFFSVVCDFMGNDIAIFVGTIFVVNGTYLELIQKKKNQVTIIQQLLKRKIIDLNSSKKEILNKSFTIRQESYGDFYKGFTDEDARRAKERFEKSIELKR